MAYFKYQGKSVYYEEYGQGEPLIFLHGNTASSKMSELLMPLYAEKFRCILIDFLGNGPVSYTHLDVYKRQPKSASKTVIIRLFLL